MTTKIEITELRDYPAIAKLASALFRRDAHLHGAAILVGAGFSRSAAVHVSREKRVPLWDEFTRNLARELYAGDTPLSFADPLRVAEEYRAYFGQGALNDKIRFEISDDTWRVGPLYRELLTLPWSEVLTTNWDTLLERAAKEIDSPFYTPVTKVSDLAWAQAPRIVKLHGTIGVTDAFVAAQEDYRTYPERSAAFVNFARHVFIENELCMLGFSGDDPNFLQWAGWVRDNLANHARRIYLVGALNLSAARRKQLESINIAPVDLYPMVADINDRDLRHQEAITQFLRALREVKREQSSPDEWRPTSSLQRPTTPEESQRAHTDAVYGASLLSAQIESLRKDRESYPGWVVCPPALRHSLANQVSRPFPNKLNLAQMNASDRAKLLYEIAWRYKVTFELISPWLSEALFDVASMDQPCGINERQQAEIAVTLLNNSRWLTPDGDEQEAAVNARANELIALIERHAFYLPDASAQIAYHRALIARDRLDFEELATLAKQVVGDDPMWLLRRAALTMEGGNWKEALDLIAQAYRILREGHRLDRRSIPLMSRLLWAHWLMDAAHRGAIEDRSEELPPYAESNYRKWRCDPWKWLDALDVDIEGRREEHAKRDNPIVPQFEQGSFRREQVDTEHSIRISDFMSLDGLTGVCGIPLRMAGVAYGVNLLATRAEKIVRYGGVNVELLDLTLAIRCASSDRSTVISQVFGRINVARLNSQSVEILLNRIRAAVGYWSTKRSSELASESLSKLRVLIEILARMSVRTPPEKAKELFRLALTTVQQPETRHHSLLEAVGSLFANALTSIPASEQKDILETALAFPLPSEMAQWEARQWPNPVVDNPGERTANKIVDDRISKLIRAVRMEEGEVERWSRSAALRRLWPLAQAGFLTAAERTSLADAIWGDDPDYASLPDITPLLPHALLTFPTKDLGRVEVLLRSHLYGDPTEAQEDTLNDRLAIPLSDVRSAILLFESMASAGVADPTRLLPDGARASLLFDRLTMWRPETKSGVLADETRAAGREMATSIGRAVSFAIAPALSASARNAGNLQQLVELLAEVEGTYSALPALIYFEGIASSDRLIEKTLASALRSRDANEVIYASIALRKWVNIPGSDASLQLGKLIAKVVGIVESGRKTALQQLLWLIRELLDNNRLSDEQCVTISEVVPDIFRSADYTRIEPGTEEAVTASTVRAECVRLAHRFQARLLDDAPLRDVIAAGRTDSLPEVRFAMDVD